MTDATFPGNGNYTARLGAWRTGNRVYGRGTVIKTGGSGYMTANPQAFATHVAGLDGSGTWTYDFTQYGSKIVVDFYRDVAGPGDYQVGFWVEMDGFGRATPTNMVVNVPPGAPTPPARPTLARVSDTSNTVNWKDAASVAAPYTGLAVERQTYNGSWSAWQAVAGDPSYNTGQANRSYGDSGTVANRIYMYRIAVVNGSGEAQSPFSVWLFTSPAAPKSVQAVKQASGSIALTWTRGTPHTEINTAIDYSVDGGETWTSLVTGLAGNVTSYTHASPPAASSIIYRAQHTIVTTSPGAVGVGLVSDYGQSNAVPLTAPPNPPSALVPNGVVFDAVAAQTFTWQHNSADSSTQTAYEIQYRIGTAAWTSTGKINSTSSQRAFAANAFTNGKNYEWQVRTWGAHATASPWSASATFQTSAAPLVAITAPGTTLAAALVTATWTYTDSEATAQSAWEAQLVQSGATLETKSGNGAATSVAFTTRLTDATAYRVRVRARDGSGLWSTWAQKSFTTSFPSPTVPTIVARWDADLGQVAVTITNPATGVAVVSNDVQRSLDDGATWESVATAPPNGIAFDKTVPLNKPAAYRVIAWSALPSSIASAVAAIVTTTSVGYWSAGNNFGQNLQLAVNVQNPPKLDLTVGLANRVLNYYAGRQKPVETAGIATTRTGALEFLIEGIDTRDQVVDMALLPAPHLIRMPDGTKLFASIGPVAPRRVTGDWYQVTFNIQEVDA